jgi:hypothetical protein
MTHTALRTTSISLDSAHQRVRDMLAVTAAQTSVKYAVIDFHQAVRKQEATSTVVNEHAASKMHESDMSPQSIQAVFNQALGVGTWFRIHPEKQEVLLKAGENAIYRHDIAASNGEARLLPEMERIRSQF